VSALDEARDRLNGLTDDLDDARKTFATWLGILVTRTAEGVDARRLACAAEAVLEKVNAMVSIESQVAAAQAAVNAAREGSL
jgi:Asp/Glu/hydantoin racemase